MKNYISFFDENNNNRIHTDNNVSQESHRNANEKDNNTISPRSCTESLIITDDDDDDLQTETTIRRSSKTSLSTQHVRFPSSLDWERIVNQYSIQALRDIATTSSSHRSIRTDAYHGYNTFQQQQQQQIDNEQFQPLKRIVSVPPPPPPHPQYFKESGGRAFATSSPNQKDSWYVGRTATRWILTILTGLLVGLSSVFMVTITDKMQEWRSNLLNILWQETDFHTGYIFLLYAGVNLTLALASASLCLFVAPEAIGSGIPEVKAFLNGVRVKRFTSLRVFIVKILGTFLSVSSGLAVGPEGPLVQIGAILGANCTTLSNNIFQLFSRKKIAPANERWKSFVTMDLSHFSTAAEQRDLVGIGSAAGFAAAFGAPIGGLLFSMEETSSYLNHSMFLRTLVATGIATFCLAVAHGDLSDFSIISLGPYDTPNQNIFLNRVAQIPFYVLMGIGGGILGGIFCRVWKALQLLRRHYYKESMRRWMIYEVAVVSILSSILMYWIPLLSKSCRPVAEIDIDEPSSFIGHQFECPPGSVNELADIFFGSRVKSITRILTNPEYFDQRTLLTVGMVFFPLMTLTVGVALPVGLFMPTFLVGSSLGAAAGMLFQNLVSQELHPATFSLLGSAALLTGIQHTTVSLCVILVEGKYFKLVPVIYSWKCRVCC